MRIELTRAILSPRLCISENFDVHFRMFLYLVTCFLRVTVSLIFRSQSHGCIRDKCCNLPYLISEGEAIVRACDLQSSETVTLRKYATKYKNMRKLVVEFQRKFEKRGDKIARVNSFRITKF